MRFLQEDDRFRIDPVLNDAPFGERSAGRGVGQPSRVPRGDLRWGAGAALAGAQPQLSKREVVEE
eukprot:4494083-Lingulodinium_polyedra.AAC.1